jgi:hypothetical protein
MQFIYDVINVYKVTNNEVNPAGLQKFQGHRILILFNAYPANVTVMNKVVRYAPFPQGPDTVGKSRFINAGSPVFISNLTAFNTAALVKLYVDMNDTYDKKEFEYIDSYEERLAWYEATTDEENAKDLVDYYFDTRVEALIDWTSVVSGFNATNLLYLPASRGTPVGSLITSVEAQLASLLDDINP